MLNNSEAYSCTKGDAGCERMNYRSTTCTYLPPVTIMTLPDRFWVSLDGSNLLEKNMEERLNQAEVWESLLYTLRITTVISTEAPRQ